MHLLLINTTQLNAFYHGYCLYRAPTQSHLQRKKNNRFVKKGSFTLLESFRLLLSPFISNLFEFELCKCTKNAHSDIFK